MISTRLLVRSVPGNIRTFACRTRCLALKTHRPTTEVAGSSIRHGSSHTMKAVAMFSTTTHRHDSEGQVNVELAGKLRQELALEKEMRDPDTIPEHLKEFLDNTPFRLLDSKGSEEVTLTRAFGDEQIKIVFSIDDLNNVDEDPDQLQESGIDDEFEDISDIPTDTQSHGANSKGAINQGRTSAGNFKVAPEDSVESSDVQSDEVADQENEPSFPAHLLVTIDKANKGTLQIEAIAQDGLVVIDNVHFFKDSTLADPKSAEQERAAARAYTGPPFGNLDEDLQILFENFLSERGINTTMALFIPEYIDFKEQREYMQWLSQVQNFVE